MTRQEPRNTRRIPSIRGIHGIVRKNATEVKDDTVSDSFTPFLEGKKRERERGIGEGEMEVETGRN